MCEPSKSRSSNWVQASDIKILLGNHAYGDQQKGKGLVKELTGVPMAMAEDASSLRAMKPGVKYTGLFTSRDWETYPILEMADLPEIIAARRR